MNRFFLQRGAVIRDRTITSDRQMCYGEEKKHQSDENFVHPIRFLTFISPSYTSGKITILDKFPYEGVKWTSKLDYSSLLC